MTFSKKVGSLEKIIEDGVYEQGKEKSAPSFP